VSLVLLAVIFTYKHKRREIEVRRRMDTDYSDDGNESGLWSIPLTDLTHNANTSKSAPHHARFGSTPGPGIFRLAQEFCGSTIHGKEENMAKKGSASTFEISAPLIGLEPIQEVPEPPPMGRESQCRAVAGEVLIEIR
jgi:hypothetical protein